MKVAESFSATSFFSGGKRNEVLYRYGKPREIRKACDMGVVDGVTTNPSLIAKENRDFPSLIQEIRGIIGDRPISLEVVGLKAEGMIEEARTLAKIGSNVVVKIPMTTEGLKAINVLGSEGIKTNTTLASHPPRPFWLPRPGQPMSVPSSEGSMTSLRPAWS